MQLAGRGLIFVLSFWMAGNVFGQNASRFDAVMRDMRGPNAAGSKLESKYGRNEVRVSLLDNGADAREYATMQSTAAEPTAAIPQHLLPDVYVSEPNTVAFQEVASPLPVESVYEVYVPNRFIFSSAFQSSRVNDRANFTSIMDDSGCCDEWKSFCLCEDCCHDLGLQPWSGKSLRRGCGVGGRRLHGANCGCQSCGSIDYSQPRILR